MGAWSTHREGRRSLEIGLEIDANQKEKGFENRCELAAELIPLA